MKIYCNKSELYRALNNAIQAVPSRSTSKILEGVLIETKEDELIITGTDTFMVVESKLSAKCDGIANFVAPAALFANIIGKLPSEDVMMEYDSVKKVLSIQSGRYRSEVICFDSTEFPKVQMKEPQKNITLNKESVRKLIRKTAFSASADEINGILIDPDEGRFNVPKIMFEAIEYLKRKKEDCLFYSKEELKKIARFEKFVMISMI